MLQASQVDIDLGASAHQNAQRCAVPSRPAALYPQHAVAPLPARYWNVCRYFADKKKTTQKFEKTAESTAKALKAAERKAQQTLKQAGTSCCLPATSAPGLGSPLPHLHRDLAPLAIPCALASRTCVC